jgi:hypothetical protein
MFTPRLTAEEAKPLANAYDAAGDWEAEVAGAMLRNGDLSVSHFRSIVKWKTNGWGLTRLDRNTDGEVRDALRLAIDARCPRSSIAVLVGLHGVDVPVASAIMAMVKPDVHTVIDFRALEALGYAGNYRSIPFYLYYRAYCVNLAREWGMTVRNLDRSLWQWSSEESKQRRLGV